MGKKTKKKASTQKNDQLDITSFILYLASGGTALLEKGLGMIEALAKKRDLYKIYPYLGEAFSNVKTFLNFITGGFEISKPKEVKKDERKKRKTRTKSHKKIQKQKTLRHAR